MKNYSIKYILAAAAALAATACAKADIISPSQVLYTFDTGPAAASWTSVAWSAGPVGWAGGGALQSTAATSGWQNWTVTQNYTWQDGSQADMQALAATGNAHLSFDIIVDGTSFTPSSTADWYNISFAANSDGGGWTQHSGNIVDGYHNASDSALHSFHLDYSFAQLGWTASAPTSWYQLNFGGNSGADVFNYYIDNLDAYIVPEPTTLTLLGLGAAALLMFRRK